MTIRELQNQLLELKRSSVSNSVAVALSSFQQELTKLPLVFDRYRALAGHFSGFGLGTKGSREPNVLAEFSVSATLSSAICILLKLVGDKEDVEVAKAILKSLQQSAPLWPHVPPPMQAP